MTSNEAIRALADLNRVPVRRVRDALAAARRGDPVPLRRLGVRSADGLRVTVGDAVADFARVP